MTAKVVGGEAAEVNELDIPAEDDVCARAEFDPIGEEETEEDGVEEVGLAGGEREGAGGVDLAEAFGDLSACRGCGHEESD